MFSPSGPRNAKIMMVGEAPGAEEERVGRPFVGGAGKILNKLLADNYIDRNDMYITNIMYDRPMNNEFGYFYEDKMRRKPTPLLLEGIERLKGEIERVNPNIIAALGNEPLKALTGYKKITKYRGSILPCSLVEGKKVLAMVHPAAIMRMFDWYPLTSTDMDKLKRESKFPEIARKERRTKKIKFITQLESFLERAMKAQYMSFDIETQNNQITCIGFSINEYEAVVVPICMHERSDWTFHEEKKVWRLIQEILMTPAKKIGQNGNYDMFFLKYTMGIEVNNYWLDTMNGFHCAYPELPKGLDTLTSLYTDIPYYKDMINYDYYNYNGLDCMATFESAMGIKEDLKEFGTWSFYKNIIHPVIPILLDMQLRGVNVNIQKKNLLAGNMEIEIKELEDKLKKAIGRDINPSSPKQVAELLYDEIGFPRKTNKHTGAVTTSEKALTELNSKYPSIILDLILQLRESNKLLSTYLNAKVDNDNRIRCYYVLSGTKSGRLASRLSLTGTGMNLQNVPKGMVREMIIPDEGNVFISSDLSQAEARVVAYLANEEGLIKIFESGRDVHTQVASALFNKPLEDITKKERALGKTIVHASNYGMGSRLFAELTGLPHMLAKEQLNRYHSTFPNIRVWHMNIEGQIRKTRILETPMGRKRQFYGRINNTLLRDAFSYIPQSTVSDVILSGMRELYNRLPEGNIVLNIHDEIVIQVPDKGKEYIKEVIKLMQECMAIPVYINGRVLKIPVESTYGYNWNEVS